jgi:hypothetical protein
MEWQSLFKACNAGLRDFRGAPSGAALRGVIRLEQGGTFPASAPGAKPLRVKLIGSHYTLHPTSACSGSPWVHEATDVSESLQCSAKY